MERKGNHGETLGVLLTLRLMALSDSVSIAYGLERLRTGGILMPR